MADEQLGLSEREKELRRWNTPWVYREFPKMLYLGRVTAGKVEIEQKVVASEQEEALALGLGWLPKPDDAHTRAEAVEAARGELAAERAWDDRRLSAKAQAEAAVIDQATLRHLPEIPEQPRRPRKPRPRRTARPAPIVPE